MTPDAALLRRAAAARELIRAGELTPETGLFLVVFPSPDLERASRTPRSRAAFDAGTRARAVQLVESGLSWAQAAEQVGASKQTVGGWVRAASDVSTVAA